MRCPREGSLGSAERFHQEQEPWFEPASFSRIYSSWKSASNNKVWCKNIARRKIMTRPCHSEHRCSSNIARIANAFQVTLCLSHYLLTLNVMIQFLNLSGIVNCVTKSLDHKITLFVFVRNIAYVYDSPAVLWRRWNQKSAEWLTHLVTMSPIELSCQDSWTANNNIPCRIKAMSTKNKSYSFSHFSPLQLRLLSTRPQIYWK